MANFRQEFERVFHVVVRRSLTFHLRQHHHHRSRWYGHWQSGSLRLWIRPDDGQRSRTPAAVPAFTL